MAMDSAANAQSVEFSFTAHVSSTFGGGSFFGIMPQTGDPVIGFLRYDLSAVDDTPDPHVSRYAQLPPALFDILLDGTHISNDGKFFTYVQNDNGVADAFDVADGESVADSGGTFRVNGAAQVGTLELSLATFSSNPFSSDAQPTNLNLANFTTHQGEVGTDLSGALFTIDSLTRVPEPSTGILALAAPSAFATRRKRRLAACDVRTS
jgi:hypothetical protein